MTVRVVTIPRIEAAEPREGDIMDIGVTRRAFVIHMGAAAALLGGALPAPAQTAPAPVAGKEKLIVRSPRPINLETPFGQLGAEITPTDLFFVRNNYDGPEIDAAQYVLKVDGQVDNPLTLRLDDLKRMEQITQTITLECAGNGRSFYSPKAPGLQWENGAVGTAVWKGVRLADILRLARPRPTASRVVPDGNDTPPTPQAPDFIRSHPIWKAMEPHTMVAIEMNGQPVPHLHGGPARLIVPGWIGSASIKWLVQLTLADKESDGPFMQRSYRSPRAEDPKHTYSLQSLECKSLIMSPLDGAKLAAQAQTVAGYAWAGEGYVTGVDISLDGDKTWAPAALVGKDHRYGWRRWEFPWPAAAGAHVIMARATDSLGRMQPGSKSRDPQGYRWNVITPFGSMWPRQLGGGLRPPSGASPRRSASRRTSRGWGPAVRGELSENCAGEAGARSGTFSLARAGQLLGPPPGGLSLSMTALVVGIVLGWGWSWTAGAGAHVGPASLWAQDANPLPRDRDQQMVTGRCIICHSLEMIAQQRQTRDEWAVIVDRMITYGMPVQPGERERILTYLAKYLGQ